MVYRIFVEKKTAQANEARTLLGELQTLLGLSGITELRLFNRYDVEGVSEALFRQCVTNVFSEPPVDDTYEALPETDAAAVFAVESLPGQFERPMAWRCFPASRRSAGRGSLRCTSASGLRWILMTCSAARSISKPSAGTRPSLRCACSTPTGRITAGTRPSVRG